MTNISLLSEFGALVGEPSRTVMLVALMDGRSLTAGELAEASGITAATASGHLSRMVEAGLLNVRKQGRHRYFGLSSPAVAGMIESMMSAAAITEIRRTAMPRRTGPADMAMRRARRCYDHLAGAIGVQLADFLVEAGHLKWTAETAQVTASGEAYLMHIGLTRLDDVSARVRGFHCRPCMDWSERRPHLAGPLGRSLLRFFLDQHWLRATANSRAFAVTPIGNDALARHFEIR